MLFCLYQRISAISNIATRIISDDDALELVEKFLEVANT